MGLESSKSYPSEPPVYDVDISSAWDTKSQLDILKRALAQLGFHDKGYLFSGFDGCNLGAQNHSDRGGEGVVYCSDETSLLSVPSERLAPGDQSAFDYATDSRYYQPAIAVYDPALLEKVNLYEYRIKNSSALLGVILLKVVDDSQL